MLDNQLKRTPIRFDDKKLEREMENVFSQMNQITNTAKDRTFIFYVAETSGGSATKKLTLELNKYGTLTKLDLV